MRSMVAALAGLGDGYMKGQDQLREQKRQDEQDAQRRSDFQFRTAMQDRQRQDWAKDDAVDAAAKPVAPVDGAVYQPEVDDDGNAMPANPTSGTYTVGGQRFASMADAQAAATQQNTPVATMRRQATAAQSVGRTKQALDLQAAAQRLTDEGHMQFIKDNMPLVPSAADIAAGKTDFKLTGTDAFNNAGGGTIPAGAYGKAFLTTGADGKPVVDFSVVDANGKPLAPSARQIEAFHGLNYKERLDAARDDAKLAGDREYRTVMADVAKRGAATAEKNADTAALGERARAGYYNVLGQNGAVKAANSGGSGKGGTPFDRMDEIDRLTYQGYGKTLEKIDDAITNAQAQGTWDPASPSSKALLSRRGGIALKQAAMLQQYGAGATGGDPLGWNAPPGPATSPAPGAGSTTAAPPLAAAPAPAPAPRSPRALMSDRAAAAKQVQAKVDADPDVIALRKQAADASSDRSRIYAQSELTKLLSKRYGL